MNQTKTYSATVTENGTVTLSGKIDERFKVLTGLQLSSPTGNRAILRRGSVGMTLGTTLIIDEGEPAMLLLRTIGQHPVQMPDLPLDGTSRLFSLRYTDTPDGDAFIPHKIQLTFFFR